MPNRCPTCGGPVSVASGEEGTCYYEPMPELETMIRAHQAAEARVAGLEAAIREAQRYCYAMSDPPRAQRILRDALNGK